MGGGVLTLFPPFEWWCFPLLFRRGGAYFLLLWVAVLSLPPHFGWCCLPTLLLWAGAVFPPKGDMIN